MSIQRNKVDGAYLRELRDACGLSQWDLATRLGRYQSFVSKVENGERELGLADVFSYAIALERDWHVLVDEVHVRLDREGYAGLPLDVGPDEDRPEGE